MRRSVLRQGDTDLIPLGGGHGSSRATYMGGTAIWRASETIVAKGKRVFALAMGATEADVVFADGNFAVPGTNMVDGPAGRGRRWRGRRARRSTPTTPGRASI